MKTKKRRLILSVIIVNHNTKDLLRQCLESLLKNSPPFPWEIVVVDNGSGDGSREFLREIKRNNVPSGRNMLASRAKYAAKPRNMPPAAAKYISFKVILNDQNLGFAKANNQGMRIAEGKYLLLLNSDTVVKEGALGKLVEFVEKNPDVAAVSPRLLNPNGTNQIDYYMHFPNIWQIILYHNILLRPVTMRTPLKYLVFSQAREFPFEVDQLPGAALMSSKKVWRETGGLDEDFSFFFEDVDWCYRVKERNLGRLIVVPFAQIIHLGGASWKKWKKRDRFSLYRQYFSSLLLFVKKHYSHSLFLYKIILLANFLSNSLVHLLRLRFDLVRIQLKLAKWVVWD